MNNLLIIGFYGFKDGYWAYGKYMKKHFNEVSFFPLIELRDRLTEKDERFHLDDIKDVIDGSFSNHKNYSDNLIVKNIKYNHILLAHNNDFLRTFILEGIKFFEKILEWKEDLKFKLYQINWDADTKNLNWYGLKNFDKCFTQNPLYLRSLNVYYFSSGFCSEMSFYKEIDEYKCDISFVGTNLYERGWENEKLNRRKILDKIYQEEDINLHVYGPEFLKELYPRCYKGFISYDDCYKVFSNSKINLNISPLENIEFMKKYYYSERLPQLFGCESIMMSNNDFGDMLLKNEDYIYLDNIDDLIEKINEWKEGERRIKMLENIREKKVMFDYDNIIGRLSF